MTSPAPATGTVKLTVVPAPGLLSTQIRPLCCSTTAFAIASPSPAPRRAEGCPCQNGSKIRPTSAGSIPLPVSLTENCISPLDPAQPTLMVPPGGVNLRALSSRFVSTCRIRDRSTITDGTGAHGLLHRNEMDF